jgi:hypothetical protein
MSFDPVDFSADKVKDLIERVFEQTTDVDDLDLFLADIDDIKDYLDELSAKVARKIESYIEEEQADEEGEEDWDG